MYNEIVQFFQFRIAEIQSVNDLDLMMDYGESESVILYRELDADFLLIDDRKAREIAQSLGVRCIGTIGFLIACKRLGLVSYLKPLFEMLLSEGRYFSVELLNNVLLQNNERALEVK